MPNSWWDKAYNATTMNHGAVYGTSQRSNIGRDFLSTIAPAIPIVGTIASGLLQRHWANKDLKAQLEYNSLAGQKQQAKEAGLPLSALVSGMNAGQSEGPRSTEISPDLGTGKALENYQMPRAKKIEMTLMQAQIDQQKALVEKTWSEALKAKAEATEADMRAQWLSKESSTVPNETNFTEMIQYDRRKKAADTALSEIEAEFQPIRNALTKREVETRIEHLFKTNQRLQQLFDDQEQFLSFKRQVIDDWHKEGTGLEGLMRLAKAVLYKFVF